MKNSNINRKENNKESIYINNNIEKIQSTKSSVEVNKVKILPRTSGVR